VSTHPGGKGYRSEDRQFVDEFLEPVWSSDRKTGTLASRQAHPPCQTLCTKLPQHTIHRWNSSDVQTTVRNSFKVTCVVSHTTGFYLVVIIAIDHLSYNKRPTIVSRHFEFSEHHLFTLTTRCYVLCAVRRNTASDAPSLLLSYDWR